MITYQIGQEGQPQTVTNGTITIPKDTAAGTSIAVMASTAKSNNYNAANKQANVTVIQKRDISDNLSITVKNTTYGGADFNHPGRPGAGQARRAHHYEAH